METVTQATITLAKEVTTAYLDALVEKPDNTKRKDFERIHPSEMKVGDHMGHHGFIYEVNEIRIADGEYGDVYCVHGTYVCGDLKMYKGFLGLTQNGCTNDYRSYDQGNARAIWHRLIK